MKPLITPRMRTPPFPTLLTVIAGCLLLLSCSAAASPLYLLNQRAGGLFTFEARRNIKFAYDAMLDDSTYNYPYAFTAEMNTMVADLFTPGTLQAIGGNVVSTFDACTAVTSVNVLIAMYTTGGCAKSLLHAGIAGDCVATNPLCCVLYWRFPASLSASLPLRDIDPRLIFWDGTKAVNGFFTNFSSDYLANYSSCAAWPVAPANSGTTSADGAALAVDGNGEWRFVRRSQPALSFVEHALATPTAAQTSELNALAAAAAPAWKAAHRFGDVTIIAPIVACSGLLVVCFVMLLLFYCCTEPAAQQEQAELAILIDNLETSTAEQEAEICRRRTRSERRATTTTTTTSSGRQTPRNNSFAKAPKQSPSPVNFNRSLSQCSGQPPSQLNLLDPRSVAAAAAVAASMGMSPSRSTSPAPWQEAPRAFAPPSRTQSNLSSSLALSRHGSQSQIQLQHPSPPQMLGSSSRRSSITPDHRRPAKSQNSPQQLPQQPQQSLRRVGSNLSRNSSFSGGLPSRPLSRNGSMRGRTSSVPLPGQRSPQSFQNPLIGRQSFKK